jgi:short-subunit dehydrogenase
MKALPGLVFITGAGSGIGQALALGYAREGARLALAVRRPDEMRDWLAANLAGQSGHEVYQADVRQRDRIVAAGHQCLSKQGVPDIVIAAAGVSVGVDSRERADLEVMADVMDTNLLGTAATFHPFIEPMQRRGRGCLVGVASVSAVRGLPGHGAYCASKAGVVAYCESLRLECRGSGVDVVTLLPGYVRTRLTAGNRYRMPFTLEADEFARRAMRAIEARARHRVIPWPMALLAALMRIAPGGVYDALASRRGRKDRRPPSPES